MKRLKNSKFYEHVSLLITKRYQGINHFKNEKSFLVALYLVESVILEMFKQDDGLVKLELWQEPNVMYIDQSIMGHAYLCLFNYNQNINNYIY